MGMGSKGVVTPDVNSVNREKFVTLMQNSGYNQETMTQMMNVMETVLVTVVVMMEFVLMKVVVQFVQH